MKNKGLILTEMIIAVLAIGLTIYTLASIISTNLNKGSDLLLEHINDIEKNALSHIDKEGIYTYSDLRLDLYLYNAIIKCDTYTITKNKVISATGCIYKNKEYCYENNDSTLCKKKTKTQFVKNDKINNKEDISNTNIDKDDKLEDDLITDKEEDNELEEKQQKQAEKETKQEEKEIIEESKQVTPTDLDRIKSYLDSANRFYRQAQSDSSKKTLLGYNVKNYLDVNSGDVGGLVVVTSDGSVELRLSLNGICYIKKFADSEITKAPVFSSCYDKSSTLTNTILVDNSNDRFMPDKYNTGANPNTNFIVYNLNDKLGPFSLKTSGNVTYKGVTYPKAIITAATLGTNAPGNYVIENYDFTNYGFYVYNNKNITEDITITFRNCKFLNVSVDKALNTHIKLIFENCTMASFSGSNTTLRRCKIGDNAGDGLTPFYNVSVISSYIANHSRFSTDGGLHLDGTQIYGQAGIDVTNIHYYNTRFENPPLPTIFDGVQSTSYTNAAIMLQLEYSNGNDITFEKIYANGGGYTIYSWCKKNTNTTFQNVLLKDIKIGYGNIYGKVYSIVSPGATLENIDYVDRLAVGSIWKDNSGVHISVTNEMLVERELTCITNKGTYKFKIPAHPLLGERKNGKWVMYGKGYVFNDMPYDIDTIIHDTSINKISIYDTTGGQSLLITTYDF